MLNMPPKQQKSQKPEKHEKPEKILENTNIVMSRVYEKNIIHNVVLTWRLVNYEELSRNIMYHQLYQSIDVKCVLRLLKSEGFLYLCVSGDIPAHTAAEFLIMNEETLTTLTNTADEIADCVFAAKFPYEKFLGPDMGFLKDGILTVSFKYASDHYTTYKERDFDESEILADLDELCCDLKTMYLESLYPDFLLHAQEYSFKTHKFVLAARSSVFDELFKKNRNVESYRLDVLPGILHQVLLYIYSGELKEMDLDCMLRVYELSFMLKVNTLNVRCVAYFKKSIDTNNYKKMFRFFDKTKSIELKNIVVHFLRATMPEVSIVDFLEQMRSETGDDAD